MPNSHRLLFVLLVTTLGCSAKLADDPLSAADLSAAPPIAQAKWCEAVAKDECGRLVGCCNEGGYLGSVAACEKNVLAECRAEEAKHVAVGDTFDEKAAGICIAGAPVRFNRCSHVANPAWEGETAGSRARTACGRVWTGKVPLGGVCTSPVDCAKSENGERVWCRQSGDESRCAIDRYVGEGEACGASTAGGPTRLCNAGLLCASPSATTFGETRCVRRGGRNEPCDPTVFKTCIDGTSCSPTTKTCVDPLPEGAACTPSMGGMLGKLEPICASPGECLPATRVCTLPLAIGAACDPTGSGTTLGCGHHAYCEPSERRCVPRKPNGSACGSLDVCSGHTCSGGQCAENGSIVHPSTCKVTAEVGP